MQSNTDIKTLVREGYNRIGSEYAATRNRSWPSGECIQDWMQYNITSGMTIVDIGCGAGQLVEVLHKTGKNVNYIGVDISSALLAEAWNAFGSQYHNVSCKWQESDMETLELDSESCDVICFIASLHHIPSTQSRNKIIQQAYNWLKPGGYICSANWYTWTRIFWKKFHLCRQAILHPFRVFIKGDIFIPWKNKGGEVLASRYIHSFRKNELKDILNKNGFKIVQNSIYSRKKKLSIASAVCTIAQKK